MQIPLSKIKPNGNAIRKSADKAKMQELVTSVKDGNRGLVVPPKVRPAGDKYEIVYGHRRIEAARQAGLKEVECIVQGVDDNAALEEALIENLVREDMNDADKRDGLKELRRRTEKTWAQIGAMFGHNDKWAIDIANMSDAEAKVLRSIDRPSAELEDARISMGVRHVIESRAAGEDSVAVLKKAAKEGLSTRQTKAVAKSVAAAKTPERKEQLIKTPFSTQIHDPEVVRKAPTIKDFKQERKERHALTPAVADAIKDIERQQTVWLQLFVDMHDAGKFSPEGARFVAGRLRKFAAAVIVVANKLGR